MNKFGLYAVDATETLDREGVPATNYREFSRTKLLYNNTVVAHTFNESNKYGLYCNDYKLILNGDDVATSTTSKEIKIANTGDVEFGNATIYSDRCINITPSDYNDLRGRKEVPGYLRYNDKYVYNVVNDTSIESPASNNVYNVDDAIYDSLAGNLEHNTLTSANYTDINLPTLVMRHASSRIKEGEGITIEYFVDTKYCDSVNKRRIVDDNGDFNTFTVIVTSIDGKELYKNTTYAGEFIITTSPLTDLQNNNIKGRTWFYIKCIDNKGRSSYEFSYDVFIEEDREENLYNMQEGEFGISDSGTPLDFATGYRNKKGLQQLIDYAKDNGYDGVKLYNRNENSTSLDDPNNSKYYIDYHEVKTLNPLTFKTEYTYYLIKVDVTANNGLGSILGINKAHSSLEKSDFLQFKLSPNSSVTVDGQTYLVDKADVFDWVRKDGARGYRSNRQGHVGKITVHWGNVEEDEVAAASGERELRIKALDALLPYMKKKNTDGTLSHTKLEDYFSEGSGLYYLYTFEGSFTVDGRRLNHTGDPNSSLIIPDNFILDFNNTGLYSTDWTDSANKFPLIKLNNKINVTLRNGKLDGNYSYDSMKTAYLKLGFFTSAIGETRTIISTGGSHCCVLDNMDIGYSIGYGLPMGPDSSNLFPYNAEDIFFTTLGYINDSGALVANDFVVRDEEENSLLRDNAVERANGATDVCLATTSDFITVVQPSMSQALFVGSLVGTGREWSGGKYDIYFVHCYDTNHQYLKSFKTRTYCQMKLPANTRYIKMTGYGVCIDNGAQITQCKDPFTGDDYALRVTIPANFNVLSGMIVKDCYIHDSRSTAITGPSINTIFKDCKFERTSVYPGGFSVTSYFQDIEEVCRTNDGLYFDNCFVSGEATAGVNGPRVNITTASASDNITFRNCDGLGIYCGFNGLCIKDTRVSSYHPYYYRARGTNFQNILRRSIITGYHALDYSETSGALTATVTFTRKSDGAKSRQVIQRNNCDEPVTNYITYEDCIMSYPTIDAGFSIEGYYAIPPRVSGGKLIAKEVHDIYEKQEEIINH